MLLQMKKISKAFFCTNALKNVNLNIKAGEICALVGLNGAGKSTLIKILSGVHSCDGGEVWINGVPVVLNSPVAAQKNGIFTLYQEPILVSTMSVADNIFLGQYPSRFGFFKKAHVQQVAAELLQRFGSDISPKAKVRDLSLSQRFIVAITRAFLSQADIFIMDEPTAGLSPFEKDVLFELMGRLKKSGKGVLFVTHTISEIIELCDRVIILRDGENVCTANIKDLTVEKIISIMSGQKVQDMCLRQTPPTESNIVLETSGLCRKKIYNNINIKLRRGEVLGLAGRVGSGRSAILKTIFGSMKCDEGSMVVRGKPAAFSHPVDAMRRRIGYLSDDRFAESLLPEMSVLENSYLPKLSTEKRHFLFSNDDIAENVLDIVIDLDIKIQDLSQRIKFLSGGNQQKLILSRWMLTQCDILLLDEPTKGIDIPSRNDIYLSIRQMAQDEGKSFIISSSDISELKMICNRVIVLDGGRIVDEMEAEGITDERILKAM